jgi:hypothetical protein
MKFQQLALIAATAVFMLGAPAVAVEYQGKNIDGKKLPGKAYYYPTGGVYDVQVSFKRDLATIYFKGGTRTTIRLKQQVITNPDNIQAFGKLGYIPVTRVFSIGFNYDNNIENNVQLNFSPLEGSWRISLNEKALNNLIDQNNSR